MSNPFLQPTVTSSPQLTVSLVRLAPAFLRSQSSWLSSLPYPLNLFIGTESQEKWVSYENLYLASLRAGDNKTAHACLDQLTKRFGQQDDRILALWGLYHEAAATENKDLADVMETYVDVLKEDPTVLSVRKRRVALLKSVGKTSEAISALTNLLDQSPTDAEGWTELSDLYVSQSSYDQAIFCLEEVLLVTPNAWNIHAKLGEVLFVSASRIESSADQLKTLSESMRRFCRSIELCDDYLRGYYGLKLSTSRLLETLATSKKSQQSSADPLAGDLAPPTVQTVQKLNQLATAKLAEIVRRRVSGEKDWDGYSVAEVTAARELLDKDTQKIER